MTDNKKMLNLLAQLTGSFIHQNGGSSNGYDTYLAGTVKPDVIGGIIELNTPNTFHMSMGRVKSLCNEFERDVKVLLRLYEFEKTVVFSYKYVKDGCYSQHISITDTIAIGIPDSGEEKTRVYNLQN